MQCPKCAFAAEDGATACARCGIVFAKIGDKGPRPRPPAARLRASIAPERGSRLSLANIVILSVILSASGALLWQSRQSEEVPASGGGAPPQEAPREPGDSGAPREI